MSDHYQETYLHIHGFHECVMTFDHPGRPVLVWLHGGPGESVMPYAGYIAKDADFATMVFYDQRGTGRTQLKNRSAAEEITFPALLDDLHETIRWAKQKYGTDKVVLLGHSWGTVLGTQYALQHPEDLLCYIGTGQIVSFRNGEKAGFDHLLEVIGTPDEQDERILESLQGYPDTIRPAHVLEDLLTFRRLQRKYHTAADIEGARQILRESGTFTMLDIPGMLSMKQNDNLFRYLLDYDVSAQNEYRIPVACILGRNDWQVPSTLAAEYFTEINAPDMQLIFIEDAGHIPYIDRPEEFRNALRTVIADYT